MNDCWPTRPGRSTSFLRSGLLCGELFSWQGEGDGHMVALGKSACFDVATVVEIDGVKAGPTRSHVAIRNLRAERSHCRTASGSSDSSVSFGSSSEFELALVFEKPGRYTLPISDITRVRCKYLHQGRASIEARDSLFLLTAASQSELERLLEVVGDVKTAKTLADSRLCPACKDNKGEHKMKKIKQKKAPKRQQQPTVLECIFRKKQLPSLEDLNDGPVDHVKDFLGSRELGSQKLNKMRMPKFESSDFRETGMDNRTRHYNTPIHEDIAPKHTMAFRSSISQSKKGEIPYISKPSSPTRTAAFIDQIRRRNWVEGPRRREVPRTVSEPRREMGRGNSVRSNDEKENVHMGADEDLRKIGDEVVKKFAQRKGMNEVLRKVQEEQRRVEDEKIRRDGRGMVDVDESREAEEKDKMVKRKESLRKLLEHDRKRMDEWKGIREEEGKREERRWKEEEDERRRKVEEERLKKSLERRLQEERLWEEDRKKEEEMRKREEEQRNRFEEARFREEEKRRKDEENRRLQELKQREEVRKLQEQTLKEEQRKLQEMKQIEEERKLEDQKLREEENRVQQQKQREEEYKRAKEAQRKELELKQSEDENQFKEVFRKLQEQIEEKRKDAEVARKEDFIELTDQKDIRKFRESVKVVNRLTQHHRRSWASADLRMSPEEIRKIFEEQLEKLDPRKLDEDMRRWRNEATARRAKTDGRSMPEHERSHLEDQRKRAEDVMKISGRLYRAASERVNDDVEQRKQAPGRDKDSNMHGSASAEDKSEFQSRGFQDTTFLDRLSSSLSSSREFAKQVSAEERLGKGGESFKPTEAFVKSDRTKQDEIRKAELERKKAEKVADEQKKRLAQERMKAAKLEAKRMDKILKEAEKRAKMEERQRQQRKDQEQAQQKPPVTASPSPPAVHYLTYRQYEDAWSKIKTPGRKSLLATADIPWPPHGNPLFIEASDSITVQRHKLRIALLRWHPDKFLSLCGTRLSPSDRTNIEACAKTVAQEVMVWKNRLENLAG